MVQPSYPVISLNIEKLNVEKLPPTDVPVVMNYIFFFTRVNFSPSVYKCFSIMSVFLLLVFNGFDFGLKSVLFDVV